ncbi:CUB and sushi domain-containing protein 3-like, partial [Anneissia japonica]|uniref:CUB and sushi domain-containing protein 3-like n=1 Tax=Anneissia japonica TaxID=1529436 RepID=UPI00142565C8
FQDLGCFYDYLENRTLPGLNACNLPEAEEMCNECTSEHPYCENTQRMTVSFCTDLCHRRGFLYSGLEAGKQCFCGNNFDPLNPPNGKPPNNDNCTEPCSGDSSQICGGELRIIIYKNDDFMNCSTSIDFSNGTVTPKQDIYASGTTVNLTCNDGFYQMGPTNSYCWYSGEFSHLSKDVQPICIRECVELNHESITEVNRMVQYQGFFIVGDTITYECSVGYESESGVSVGDLECREDRIWAANLPVCKGVSCGNPGTPNKGELIGEMFVYPNSVSYKCQPGYTIVGSTNRTCQPDKSWSGTLPSCSPNDCGNLDNIENGMTSYTGTTFGMNTTYTCNIGYNINGVMIRTCEATGLWSGSPPTCEVVNCGIVSVGEGVFINGGIFTYNAVLMFICDRGYNKVSGDTTRTCQADGNWSGNDLVCEIVNCGDPGTPTWGEKTGSDETYGSTVNYVCNTGYNLVGSTMVTCQSNGTWSDSPPTCQLVNCGDPGTPTNGEKNGSDETYGSTVTYVCDNGYNLIGTAMVTCQSDGTWSNSTPTCQIVDCKHPGSPLNVTVDVNETTYGAIATYSCLPGYSISSGNNWRTCGPDGSWTGIEPTCS